MTTPRSEQYRIYSRERKYIWYYCFAVEENIFTVIPVRGKQKSQAGASEQDRANERGGNIVGLLSDFLYRIIIVSLSFKTK